MPEVSGLSAVLPSHPFTGDRMDLVRAAVLIRSMERNGSLDALTKLHVVVPEIGVDAAQVLLDIAGPSHKIEVVSEADIFLEEEREVMRQDMAGWHRQQVIKLAAPRITDSRMVLMLDSDVVNVRRLAMEELSPDGRVPVQLGTQFEFWIKASADLVGVAPPEKTMSVTPAFLSVEGLRTVHRLLDAQGPGWIATLAAASRNRQQWTEYLVYQLSCQKAGIWDDLHVVAASRIYSGVWKNTKINEKLLDTLRNGNPFFLVNQSIRPDTDDVHAYLSAQGFPSWYDLTPAEIRAIHAATRETLAEGKAAAQRKKLLREYEAWAEPLGDVHDAVRAASEHPPTSERSTPTRKAMQALAREDFHGAASALSGLLVLDEVSPKALKIAYQIMGQARRFTPIYVDAMARSRNGDRGVMALTLAVAELARHAQLRLVGRLLRFGWRQYRDRAAYHRLVAEMDVKFGKLTQARWAIGRALRLSPTNAKYIDFGNYVEARLSEDVSG